MCGIAGLLSSSPIADPQVLADRLDGALAHRGPDDAGRWHGEGVLLLHRRLAILDLSPDGHQPMVSACGRWLLVFNGEIYNYRELRGELQAQGHRFHSTGDSEVLLQLLIRYGTAALDRLRGMYAFCLWDCQQRRALLARDPFGIKPLYLHRGPQGQLLFASEVRALLASGLVPRRLNAAGLRSFLAWGHCSAVSTLVQGIDALPPGHLAQWQQGELQIQPFWRPSFAPEPPLPYAQLVARTREALEQSVALHLRADVPVGLFLSGGLDSSALLALAGSGLRTLSIGFAESGFDESQRAATLANHFGAQHSLLRIGAHDAASALHPFLEAIDLPSVDGFNTFCVSRLAAAQGLKVVLSGLGGDELFGGYPSFQRLPRALAWQRQLPLLRPWMAHLLEQGANAASLRLAAGLRQPRSLARAFAALRGLFAPVEIEALLRHWQLDSEGPVDPPPADLSRETFPSPKDAVAWLESSLYMGDQLLRDSDTYSMACGLELRLPLVDVQLFRAVAAQPARWRLQQGKRLLRDAVPELEQVVPFAVKQGFSFPFRQWFETPGSLQEQWLAISPATPPGLDLQPWARRWGLMVLNQWMERSLGFGLE